MWHKSINWPRFSRDVVAGSYMKTSRLQSTWGFFFFGEINQISFKQTQRKDGILNERLMHITLQMFFQT